jgi:hypothetical protein
MLDGYEVDFFKTKANTYANIEIPSENPTFEDDIQIKGIGQTEEEAFEDLKQNYEKYKKGLYEIVTPATAASIAASAAANAARGISSSGGGGESNPWALLALAVGMSLPIIAVALDQSGLGRKIIDWVKYYKLNRVIDRLRKDPEVLEFIKNKKPGIQNFLKSKLTDKEQKYIKQISWNKITKGEIYEINSFLDEAEGKKNPPIGKPKRGGSKKFYVYVKNKGKVKKVSFGQVGMSAKINDPKARRAFAARHDCKNKTDRTKPSYWSCRLPRYAKLLGLKSSFSGFW